MSDSKRFFYPIAASILVIIGMMMGYFLQPNIDSKRASKFEEVLNALDREYVDSIDKNKMFDAAINDMLHKLDPHSRYISAKNLRQETEAMQGSFGGIGVRFQIINDTICVIKAIDGAPAYRAGVRSGDQIIAINGKPFTGKKATNDKVMSNLKGEPDTEVQVTILRNKKQKKITINRGEIPLETVSVYYMLNETTGLIRIDQFSVLTYDEFITAAQSLIGKGMKSLVLDLRNNPGGVMDAAINVADEFLVSGDKIVSTKSKRYKNDVVKAQAGGILEKTKLVVLIDENSASASEILAGAIQDNDRGLLVGRRTYGKGLVQQDQILNDGSSVRMTISRYYTPSGRSIQRPYSGNYEEYMRDESRYIRGEFFHEDSIPIDRKLVYKTKRGNKVYGGGGIVPNVFIPLDTSGASIYLVELNAQQVISAFVFKSLQQNRTKWKSIETLCNHNFSIYEIQDFTSFAQRIYKLDGYSLLSQKQKDRISEQIKIEFGQQLWGELGAFRVITKNDSMLIKALALLR
jgi:carboxyl-terminal processing protease